MARNTVADVARLLEQLAPVAWAEDRDNVGLILGDRQVPVRRLLLTIDLTLAVLQEAVALRAGMVMAYHPPIYRPVSRLLAEGAPPVWETIRRGIAVYSMHTALDAVEGGTNDCLAAALGLRDVRPLRPLVRQPRKKIVVFLPPSDLEPVSAAAFAAGAGRIGNYAECSFHASGHGTFHGLAGSHPTIGQAGSVRTGPVRAGRREDVEELRLEFVAPADKVAHVVSAIVAAHSYETPAIDVYPLEDRPAGGGHGRIGRLERAVSLEVFASRVKRRLGVRQVWTAGRTGRIEQVACCAGSCHDYLGLVLASGAQAYVTGEMSHHDALAVAATGSAGPGPRGQGMAAICVGHSNSERPALAPLAERIRHGLPGLDVRLAKTDRDPFVVR